MNIEEVSGKIAHTFKMLSLVWKDRARLEIIVVLRYAAALWPKEREV